MNVRETIWLIVELTVLFYGVTFLVQLFQRRLGGERLRVWMGGRPIVAALKGIAIGFVTPFCTFTAVPMLLGLRQAGVPPAGYVAFIVAAPVLDPVLFGALVLIVGLNAAVIYAIVAFVAAITLAMTAEFVGIERHMKPVDQLASAGSAQSTDASACTSACDPNEEVLWRGAVVESRAAASSAARLLRTMAPLLSVGIALSLVIETLVPAEVMAQLTSVEPRLAIPIAAALGTPLYVSTGVFVPIADSLRGAGVGTGAIVALTIAGAGANVPEFVILSKLAKPRLIAVFFMYVFGVAIAGGLLAQALVVA